MATSIGNKGGENGGEKRKSLARMASIACAALHSLRYAVCGD